MPQMMPLNWLTLFCMFIILFILFNIISYYNFYYNSKSKINLKKSVIYNWKW